MAAFLDEVGETPLEDPFDSGDAALLLPRRIVSSPFLRFAKCAEEGPPRAVDEAVGSAASRSSSLSEESSEDERGRLMPEGSVRAVVFVASELVVDVVCAEMSGEVVLATWLNDGGRDGWSAADGDVDEGVTTTFYVDADLDNDKSVLKNHRIDLQNS